jgi:hypothetical protein
MFPFRIRSMTLKVVAYGLVGVATCLLFCVQMIFAQGKLTKNTRAGQALLVDGYARSDNNCQGLDPPKITIDQPPEHGIVCWRRGDLLLKTTIESNFAHCLGRKIDGFHLIYLSHKDYTGSDHIRYTVQFPTTQYSVEVTLNVLPDRAKSSLAAPADTNASAGETPQPSGPIPPCPTPVS